MADKDFDFDNLLSGSNAGNTRTTSTTSNTDTKEPGVYPFSVRLDTRYVEIIKALAWYRRISQREFIEQAIDGQLAELGSKLVNEALNKYRDEQSG